MSAPGIPVFRQGEDVKTATATRPQTRWPPQSFVAPVSWLLTRDVEQGRDELNFSTWDSDDGEADAPPRRSPRARCRRAAMCSSIPTPG